MESRAGETSHFTYYTILPYVRSKQPIQVRGITFHSTEDVAHLSQEDRSNILELRQMFYLRHDIRIKEMLYVVQRFESEDTARQSLPLLQAHDILGYFIGSVIAYENASLFLLQKTAHHPVMWTVSDSPVLIHENGPAIRKPDLSYTEPCYEGWHNFRHYEIHPVKGRIYPRTYPPVIPHVFDLSDIFCSFLGKAENWALNRLVSEAPNPTDDRGVIGRVFRALPWYNQSCLQHLDRPEASTVYLAIAFEALLDMDLQDAEVEKAGPQKFGAGKARFFEALYALVGHVPNLDVWAEQFYDARSKTVHRGMPPSLRLMVPTDDNKTRGKTEQRTVAGDLTQIGKVIFRTCLTTILAGHYSLADSTVPEAIVHNDQRLRRICRILQGDDPLPKKLGQVSMLVNGLDSHQPWRSFPAPASAELVMTAGQRLFGTFLTVLKHAEPQEIRSTAEAIIKESDRNPPFDLRDLYVRFRQLLTQTNAMTFGSPLGDNDITETLRDFSDYACKVLPFHFRRSTEDGSSATLSIPKTS